MKLKLFLLLLLLPVFVSAKSYLASPIPLPKTYMQDLDPYVCDEECLKEELQKGYIFSFLAHSPTKLDNKELNEQRLLNLSLFNIGAPISTDKLKIAIIIPYKIIGRYAASTTNSVFAYLLTKNRAFDIKTFNIDSQDKDVLSKTIHEIENEGFYYAIAPLTKDGVDTVIGIDPQINIFFPTVNKDDVVSSSNYLYFGGIDYKAQTNLLLKEAVSPLVVFKDKSILADRLSKYAEDKYLHKDIDSTGFEQADPQSRKVFTFSIDKSSTNLKDELFENKDVQYGSFLTNTPVVKTGMIMSQLTLYDVNETNVLSTQINYDPLILSMTQFQDRENMIIANSISKNNNIIIETNSLLSNDIVYDWINYATTVGIDYFFNLITNVPREYPLQMVDHQIIYPITLVKPSYARFRTYKSGEK
ncbi:hypothetical protein [Sulfurimonas sp. HSL-1716]|uniref:hypothetical protein n=1 Tax=Hydrocurvibacter sulfurireducens TaxID=3131937 RepID=UPI0031F74E92